MSPLVQPFLLILSSVLFHIGVTNPNVKSTGDYVPYEGVGLTSIVRFGPKLGKLLIWISTLYQMLYLYLEIYSPALTSKFFPQILASAHILPMTPISSAGYILMIIGGLGRIWCYRNLGSFFTFELTIRHSHKLIKSGPYGYVRHPSYTFACIMTIGMFLIHQRLAHFFPNRRWMQIVFGPLGFLTCCIILILIITRRVTREEKELKKTFGNEWIQYASKTKRFLPKLI